jgi:hypothetical protein
MQFSFEKAATGAGWLQSLKETNQIAFTDVNGITKVSLPLILPSTSYSSPPSGSRSSFPIIRG